MADELDGLLTFFASHHAIRADKTLQRAGLATQLIPGPKELSPNCGVAVRFGYTRKQEALKLLEANRVQVDEVHRYQPQTDGWERPARDSSRRFWRKDRQ